jgi:hypothetical protein
MALILNNSNGIFFVNGTHAFDAGTVNIFYE